MIRPSAIVALTLGALAALTADLVTELLKLEESLWSWGLGAFIYFIAALITASVRSSPQWNVVPLVFAGIAIGFVIDAVIRGWLFDTDANLLPLGIAIWWIIGAVPICAGFALGKFLARSQK